MTLIVRPTANLDDIKAVLSHPAIWDAITADGHGSADNFDWSIFDKMLSIGGYVDGKPIAIGTYHGFADGDKGHIHVLPGYRSEYARKFFEEAIKYAQHPVYVEIPEIYPNVKAFVESFGFRQVENLQSLYTKRGEKYAITRYVRAK